MSGGKRGCSAIAYSNEPMTQCSWGLLRAQLPRDWGSGAAYRHMRRLLWMGWCVAAAERPCVRHDGMCSCAVTAEL